MTRKRIAQACAAIAAASMFLPWQTTASEGVTESVQGIGTGEGPLIFIVGLVTIGLIQVGWRPAWIGAGLIGAITIRAILDSGADPASGLWIAAAAAVVAVGLLVWDMFANVTPGGDDGRAGGRGLSGPLGRRRQ